MKTKIAVFLISVAALIGVAAGKKNYTYVATTYGVVRGQVTGRFVTDDLPNQRVAAFLGIPYAKPPLGELRFRRPQPPDPWYTTLKADSMPPACPQHSEYLFPWYDSGRGKSEDCLYLNVWAPFNITHKRVVKLYIHGGGFSSGSNRMSYYNGGDDALDNFSDSDFNEFGGNFKKYLGVVVVVINYRLGALGFLTSGTEDAPGNVGLYDMVQALHWVRDNIAAFGGDPDLITLAGQGAGAMAISLFTVSPLTRGLFKRAIMTGGNFMSIRENKFEDNLKLSQRLATAVGCNSTSLRDEPKQTVQCLRNVSASRFAVELSSFSPTSHYFFYPQYGRDDLIPLDPVVLLDAELIGNVDIFFVYGTNEGSYLFTTMRPDIFGVFGEKNTLLNATTSKELLTEYLSGRGYSESDAKSLPDQLLKGLDSRESFVNRARAYTAAGDENVVCPFVYFAEKYADRFGKVIIFRNLVEFPYHAWARWMGVAHFDIVQTQFFHAERELRVHGKTYPLNDDQRALTFYTKLIETAFSYGIKPDVPQPRFTRLDRKYTFENQTGSKYDLVTLTSPARYNCGVYRPYFEALPLL